MKRSNQKSHNQMRDADGRFESTNQSDSKQDKRGGRSMQNAERQRDAEGRFVSENKAKK